MAAGTAGLRFMKDNNLLYHTSKLGDIMLRHLKEAEDERRYIREVRGIGLMIGVEFVKDKQTKGPWPEMASNVRMECYKRGVIVELGRSLQQCRQVPSSSSANTGTHVQRTQCIYRSSHHPRKKILKFIFLLKLIKTAYGLKVKKINMLYIKVTRYLFVL